MKLRKGEIVLITRRWRKGYDTRVAKISGICGNRCTFVPHYRTDFMPSGQGSFNAGDVGRTRFGVVAVDSLCIVESFRLRPWNPKPGDPHYDSVH